MPTNARWTRREALRAGGLAAAAALVRPSLAWADCDPTPGTSLDAKNARLWSGPYWREGTPFRHNLRGERADGRVLVVSGRVLRASDCRPVPGAVLDVWHCSPDGEYFTDPEDQSAGLFRGRMRCDETGFYEYETLVPANYRVDGAMRPAHIHVTAHIEGREDYNTQMYFEGDPHLEDDPLEIVHEPLICKLAAREPGDTVGGRRSTGPFFVTEFDLVVPREG